MSASPHALDEQLLAGFTAHNIALPDGTFTLPGEPVVAETGFARAAVRLAQRLCPAPARVVDLGCLEGGHAVEFARAGYEVVGIEARAENFARCELVRRRLGLDNLTFAHDDVRNVAEYGEFDIVFCSGLLYHLDQPVAFLHELGRVAGELLILHTHYAQDEPHHSFPLGQLVEHEGCLGRWLREAPTGSWRSDEEMEASRWASWGNDASFWLHKRHLLRVIQDAGFPIVLEQFDWLEDIVEDGYIEHYSRSMFAGVKA